MNPLVSICCTTYNHGKYIRDTINAFLMQRCDFEYEILIHDDASTDDTQSIILEFQNRYPDVIFAILQKENQLSQKIIPSHINYRRARGKYLAICEGDDRWTDPDKLAKQVKKLCANQEYHLCFHPAYEKNVLEPVKDYLICGRYLNHTGFVSTEDVIAKSYGMIPTASMMVTSEAMAKVLSYVSCRSYLCIGDIYIQIISASMGKGAIYIDEVMSIYHSYTESSWSLANSRNPEKYLNNTMSIMKSYFELDRMYNFEYHLAYRQALLQQIYMLSSPLLENYEVVNLYMEMFYSVLIRYLSEVTELKKIYLYGAGSFSGFLIEKLSRNVLGVIDSDATKWGNKFYSKPVCSPTSLNSDDVVFISLLGRESLIIRDSLSGHSREQIMTANAVISDDSIFQNLYELIKLEDQNFQATVTL
ncbi:glycosyltransferase family 2 protein [Aeromonas veronii]|uniref:glycosyltransferase family 2 protein n=1 Tax=Aeromonas veronii TaxID=654 RepID=UPI003BA2F458